MNRKYFPVLKFAAAAVFAGSVLSACVSGPRHGSVYVKVRPPAILVETQGSAPGSNHVWIAGYHAWRGSEYVWVPGHWDARPRPGAVWVNGTWKEHRDGWYWVDGRWK
jgi:hypothetical protein